MGDIHWTEEIFIATSGSSFLREIQQKWNSAECVDPGVLAQCQLFGTLKQTGASACWRMNAGHWGGRAPFVCCIHPELPSGERKLSDHSFRLPAGPINQSRSHEAQ